MSRGVWSSGSGTTSSPSPPGTAAQVEGDPWSRYRRASRRSRGGPCGWSVAPYAASVPRSTVPCSTIRFICTAHRVAP
eukprot:3923085-Rhodomonas_salina.2